MILLAAFDEAFSASYTWKILMTGMQAGALGLIIGSIKGLFWNNRKQHIFWILLALSFVPVYYFPSWEPIIIVVAGGLAIQFKRMKRISATTYSIALIPFLFGDPNSTALQSSTWLRAWTDLFMSTFKAGAFVFGSGLAIVPMMQADFVERLGWLTEEQFMNALAFGQITPGPVTITGAFIGFQTLGFIGALTGTIGIFGAPFIHMTTWFPRVMDKLSEKKWITDFLVGAIAAVVAAIVITVIRLAMAGDFDQTHYLLMIAVMLATQFGRIPAWALVPCAGIVSLVISSITSRV